MLALTSAQRSLALCCMLIGITLLLYGLRGVSSPFTVNRHIDQGSQNATLGFGTILVLSQDHETWRVQGLRKAAKFVGLHLTIPTLHPASDEDVEAVVEVIDNVDERTRTSIQASRSHIAILESFLNSTHETALILEDDVDFDIHLRDRVELLGQVLASDGRPVSLEDPWSSSSWEVLWLGHCSVDVPPSAHIIEYKDPHVPPFSRITSTLNDYYRAINSETGLQQLILGVWPVCTYAYAVKREAAGKLLENVRHKTHDFDLVLHDECRDGRLTCMAPVPELFHHHEVVGESKIGAEFVGAVDGVKEDLEWARSRHQFTYNILWSARCTSDHVGEKLGDRWQCLPGKYD